MTLQWLIFKLKIKAEDKRKNIFFTHQSAVSQFIFLLPPVTPLGLEASFVVTDNKLKEKCRKIFPN